MDTALVRTVARALRYQPLEHLTGRIVEVDDLDRVEAAVRLALGPNFPDGCRLLGPELSYREGAVAKYGFLDLTFAAPADWLTKDARSGVHLLRELGYLPGKVAGFENHVCDDPTCLEMLQENLARGETVLRLFLEGGNPGPGARLQNPDGTVTFRVPASYLPRPFRIRDACVTNAAGVWLWKHFYL